MSTTTDKPDWKMHSPSDGPPTQDRSGTETSDDLQAICETLMNRTDCQSLRVYDAERGKIGYDSKRVYISQNVLNKIYLRFDGEVLYADGGHAEFIYLGTENPDN